jgi:hypothetical protein
MELRKGRRLPLQLPVSFTSNEVTGTGIIYNLSNEGCAIESEIYMPMNSYLQLQARYLRINRRCS